MDIPDPRRDPTCSQSQFRVSRTGGTTMIPKAFAKGTTLPRGGLIRSRIAVGAEIFGFTTAFLRGSGFFSLSESCDPIPFFSSRCYRATARNPLGTSTFAAAPLPLRPSPFRKEGFHGSDVWRSYLADRVFLRGSSRFRLWMVLLGLAQVLPSALFLLVHQREAGFLQGVTLRRDVPLSQEEFNGIASFSRLRARGRILVRGATKFA